MDVVHKLIIHHLHMANSHWQTQHLLYLKLDHGLYVINFGHHVLIVGQQGRGLPMLFRHGPRIYGTCLNRDSGAKKSYLLASFLTRFIFLLSSVPWCSYGRFIHSLSFITVLLVSQNIYGELGKGNELKPDSAEKCLSFWGHSSSGWSEDPPFPEHFGTCVDSHAGLPALSHTGCHRRLHCSWCLVPQ